MPTRRVRTPLKVEKKLLSRVETASMLGDIHARTVDAMVKSGQLKAVKLGRRNMITAKSVEELVAAQ